ncbi:MAG: YcaO-like family protein [Oscillospiraceae bacterium]|nr:YcaO-like family protein [Oscillospiraceae bacterium]
MIDTTIATPDVACKDAHPVDTVNKIKGILATHGIEIEESWGTSNVPHCYSLRVSIAGTQIGANGKGVAEELALASAYGELMERLQVGLIWRNKLQAEDSVSSCEAQSRLVNAEELLQRNFSWYTEYAQQLRKATNTSMTEREIMNQYVTANGSVQATAYYCATTGTTEYLPAALVKSVYGTNGAAAGNTMEEAMVQALSEIVERKHKLRIIYENIPVPDIPEERLRTCSIAYEIIQYLRSQGLRVVVRDCSLGTKFPVVCVCLIDTKTGRYHTHFGAFPDFEIALQRTLTETFQGRNIKNIAAYEGFSYQGNEASYIKLLMNELALGTSEKQPQFFYNVPQEPYLQTAGFTGRTNKERLKECIEFFREQGYDVLVRDSSCLGFPTCQIIVPGYSEALPYRLSNRFNEMRYASYANKALRNPACAKPEEMMGLLMHLAQSGQMRYAGVEDFLTEAGIPAILGREEKHYLMNMALAHVRYSLGKHGEVISHLDKAIRTKVADDEEYLICLKRYLSLRQEQYTADEIKATLTFLHNPETVEKLYTCLSARKNPLDSLVLRCDLQCQPDCRLYTRCRKKETDRLVQLVVEKSKAMDQSAVENLFQELYA